MCSKTSYKLIHKATNNKKMELVVENWHVTWIGSSTAISMGNPK
jgi:hypothetical protein